MQEITRDMELKAREMSKILHKSENAGEKADTWICGNILLSDGAPTNCSECGKICYYDTKMENSVSENHKKICIECAWRNHMGTMTALEQQIVNYKAKLNGWKK